jgi:hypothetical protein
MDFSATPSGQPVVQIEATPFDFRTIQDKERFKRSLVQIQDEEEMRKEEQEAIQRILAESQIQDQEEMRKQEQEAIERILAERMEAIHHIATERTMMLEHGRQAELAPAEKCTHEIQSMLQEAMTERVLMEIEPSMSQPLVYLQPKLFPAGRFRREFDNGSRVERATGAGPAEAAVISVEIDVGPAQERFTLSMKTPGPHLEIVKDSSEGAEGGIYSYAKSGTNLPSVPPDLPPRLWEARRDAAEGVGSAESDIEVQQQLPTGVWQVWGEGAGAREGSGGEGSRGAYSRDRQGEF